MTTIMTMTMTMTMTTIMTMLTVRMGMLTEYRRKGSTPAWPLP